MNRALNVRMLSFLLGASISVSGVALAAATPHPWTPQQTAPDNTKMNKGDTQKGVPTADQQKMNSADTEITRKIRAAVMDDKSLSTYAHNIKIITQDGKVTLKGPVRTEKEKAEVEATAASIAGTTNVTSEIAIAPAK